MLNKVLFSLVLLMIVIVAMPLGANRPWAWATLQVLIFFIAGSYAVNKISRNNSIQKNSDKSHTIPNNLFITASLVIMQCFVAMQIFPFGEWLPRLGEHSYTIWQSIGSNSSLSTDIAQTKVMLLKGISYTIFVWLLSELINSSKRIKTLAIAIFAAGFIQAMYACLEILLNWKTGLVFSYYFNSDRADGAFVYHNHLANYLLLTGAIAIGLLIGQFKSRKQQSSNKRVIANIASFLLSNKFIIRVGIIVIIIGLILTRSRMGNSAFFIAIGVISLYAWFFYNRRPKAFSILIISLFVLDLVIVGAIFGVEKVQQRIQDTSLASETRDDVVVDGMVMLKQVPILGSGAGSFYSAFPQFQSSSYSAFYDHAHNDYLQFLVEFGWFFSLVGLLLISYVFILGLKGMRFRKGREMKGLCFGGCVAIVGMMLHITVDFNFQPPANTLIFLSVLVLVQKSYHYLKQLNHKPDRFQG